MYHFLGGAFLRGWEGTRMEDYVRFADYGLAVSPGCADILRIIVDCHFDFHTMVKLLRKTSVNYHLPITSNDSYNCKGTRPLGESQTIIVSIPPSTYTFITNNTNFGEMMTKMKLGNRTISQAIIVRVVYIKLLVLKKVTNSKNFYPCYFTKFVNKTIFSDVLQSPQVFANS